MKSNLSSRWIPPKTMTDLVGKNTADSDGDEHEPVLLPEDNLPPPPPPPDTRQGARRPGAGWIFMMLILSLAALGGLFYTGWKPAERRHDTLATESNDVKNAALRVAVIAPKKSAASIELLLPGEVQAERETGIYARTSGYVKKWSADIGDHVKEGQTLAVIDTPEVDSQLEQARVALTQSEAMQTQSEAALEYAKAQHAQSKTLLGSAKAKLDLAEQTLKRYTSMRGNASINEEMISEKEADFKAARSNLNATQAAIDTAAASVVSAESAVGVSRANIGMSKAAIKRLEVLQGFEQVTAPFAGTITQRQTEVGALVGAGGTSPVQALFHIAATDSVRVYIDVPQTVAPSVKEGQKVDLLLREYPDGKFSGEVVRTTRSIDTASRTLRTEVRVKNPGGELLRGMYTQVKLIVPRVAPTLLVPGSALVVNADGTQLAIVKDGRVHFQKIVIEGDYGTSVGISAGLLESDVVIANPSERLQEGLAVVSAPAK